MDKNFNEKIKIYKKNNKKMSKDDKEYIYHNYIMYINKKKNFDDYQKDLITNYLRNMLVHTNKVLLVDELDNSIHDILQTSKEKEILSNNLKLFMERRRLNVNELAIKLNLAYSTVNDWVNGVSYPRQDKLRRLAEALGVTKKDLIEPYNPNKKANVIPVLGTIPARYSY